MTSTPAAPEALDLLVLGGTSWLGGVVARSALAAGHRVTCLARGDAGSPPAGATWVRADRSGPAAYEEVAGRDWDAVVEVSWQPAFVRGALQALAPTTQHWVYVSSCSVYSDELTGGADESASVHAPYEGDGPVDWDVYGPAKVACERACRDAVGAERLMVARAGLIGGYGDRSDRLGYWPARMARAGAGEAVLVPPTGSALQVVDVEDLATWLVLGGERRLAGVFNAVGDVTSVGDAVTESVAAAGASPELVEVDDDWLVREGVEPWSGPESLPLWLPQSEYSGFMTRDGSAARRAGLVLRPLAETVAASLRWELEQGLGRGRRAGLTPAREADLLTRARPA